jgi:RND family efflux transporter MFP subunit
MSGKKRIAYQLIGVVVAAAVMLGAMAWLAGFFRTGKIEPGKGGRMSAEWTGPTTQVVRAEQPRMMEVVGTIEAESRSSISPRLMANIIEINVRAGDVVKKGDVLARLDDVIPRARVEQAKEALKSAEANRNLAQAETNRILSAGGAISASERETWLTKFDSAKSEVKRAEQAVKEAEASLSDATILAPYDGVVIDRKAEPGDQATMGRVLLTMYDPSKMRIEASVREGMVGRLKAGQKVQVKIDSINQIRDAKVDQIVPAADPSSRSFLVKALLVDSSGAYPGMYARLQVPGDAESMIRIPSKLVREVGQMSYVTVIENKRELTRAVRIGKHEGEWVEILSGLSAGETLKWE